MQQTRSDTETAGTSIPEPVPDGPPNVTREEVSALVEEAFTPDLQRLADNVNLTREMIEELVVERADDLARVGSEEQRILASGRLEYDRISKTIEEASPRRFQPRWWVGTAILLLLIASVLAAIAPGSTIDVPLVAILSAAGVIAALGVLWAVLWRARTRMIDDLRAASRRVRQTLDQARASLTTARVESTVRPAIRAAINARSDVQYRTSMGSVTAEGLTESFDARYLITTEARTRLDRFLESRRAASIALSGPRGSGKTSLIRATCPSGDDQPRGVLGVVVSAPVAFDGRDFVLYLFSELCRVILGHQAVEQLRHPGPLGSRRDRSDGQSLVLLVAGVALLAGGAMLSVAVFGFDPHVVWAVAILTAGGAALGWVVWPPLTRYLPAPLRWYIRRLRGRVYADEDANPRFSTATRERARLHLLDIWFQQSFTSGWSGAIKLPIGVEGGVEGSRELARQQMTLPDIVGDLRRLIEHLTTSENTRVLIGIDELDKIDAPEDVSRFVNEIKAMFGISGCVYLVSISEDAMASFERRGMPIRDAIDSSFADVIKVDYFKAARTVELLRGRVVGMPVPFMLLCHCLAGGLPRDTIRFAWETLGLTRTQRAESEGANMLGLSDACLALVARQLAATAEATLVATRQPPSNDAASGVARLIEGLPRDGITADGLVMFATGERATQAINGHRIGNEAVRSPLAELMTFAYFCATLLEFFTDKRRPDDFIAATYGSVEPLTDTTPAPTFALSGDGGAQMPALGDEFARARQAFAVDPVVAWEWVSRVRERLQLLRSANPLITS